jgi:putative transposase
MPRTTTPVQYLAQFQPADFYHVYNRSNYPELLFRNDENRRLFLEKFKKYLAPYVNTFAYILLDNHFHLSIRIRSEEELFRVTGLVHRADLSAAQRKFLLDPYEEGMVHDLIEGQFSRLFTSYAMKYNLSWQRTGNLFHRPFKRVEVADDNHLLWLIYYIHHNPLKHGLTMDFTQYRWSSYRSLLSNAPTLLERDTVLEWFGGKDRFETFHRQNQENFHFLRQFEIED